jgi:trimeric autotransporter adhesin
MKARIRFILAATVLAAFNFQLSTAFAQGTAFTYQGRVTDNGTNFNGIGQFEFALVTSSNANSTATATANAPSGGYITGYVVTYGGNGYVTPPTVTISGGGGSGAAAHANISGGVVTSITVDNTGNGGYTSPPTVTIDPPPANITYTTYWSNDGTSVAGSEPNAAVSVAVTNGLFTVTLGDTNTANMAAIDSSLFMQPNLQLRIWFNDGVNGFAALNPVQNLTPAPYAVTAVFANSASNLVSGLAIQQNSDGAPDVIEGASLNYVLNSVIGATISGGGWDGGSYSNKISADFGTISGGDGNTINDGANAATIGGGADNIASGYISAILGGAYNTASSDEAIVGGGLDNTANGNCAIVGGGYNNTASGLAATVGGGYVNTADGANEPTVAGGNYNIANAANQPTVGGGTDNQATNDFATVPGGAYNVAGGKFSFAAGNQAQALHQGAFVWADSENAAFSSTTNDEFSIRAQNGVRIQSNKGIHLNNADEPIIVRDWDVFATNAPADKVGIGRWGLFMEPSYLTIGIPSNDVPNRYFQIAKYSTNGVATQLVQVDQSGNIIAQGTVTANGVLLTSDRNAKENFTPLDAQTVLAKVVALPMSEWNYKSDSAGQKHIGPMAQDFHAAFGLDGKDDKHISVIDEGGVALAAIQGLNQKLEEQKCTLEKENATLKQQNDSLQKQLNELAAAVKSLAKKK